MIAIPWKFHRFRLQAASKLFTRNPVCLKVISDFPLQRILVSINNRGPPQVINNGRTVMVTSTPPKLNKMRSFPAYVGAPGNLNGIRKSPNHGKGGIKKSNGLKRFVSAKKPQKNVHMDGVPPVEVSPGPSLPTKRRNCSWNDR